MTRAAAPATALAIGAVALAIVRGQVPAQGDITATGRVFDAVSGSPLAAVVTLNGHGSARRVLSNANGRFEFARLPAGPYSLAAARPGYFPGAWRQRQPAGLGQPLDLTPDVRQDDRDLHLWKQGAIAGRVTGAGHDPLPGADVHALRRSVIGGRWRDVDAGSSTSDDQGHFRIVGLVPGRYVLVAEPPPDPTTTLLLSVLAVNPAVAGDVLNGIETSPRGGPDVEARVPRFGMTRVPASTTGADTLSLAAGASAGDVSIALPPASGVRASGAIVGAGQPPANVQVQFRAADDDGNGPAVATTACTEDGRFEFAVVPPGRYVADVLIVPPATREIPTVPTLWAREPVVVGPRDSSGITIGLHRGVVLSGRAVFDGDPPPAAEAIRAITLRLDPADRPSPPASGVPVWRGAVRSDGQVEWMGVPAGQYFVRVAGLPRGWTTQSAMVDGRDALDDATDLTADRGDLVLTLTTTPAGSVGGTIHDSADGHAEDATVVIFPVDPALRDDTSPLSRRLRATRPSPAGGYGIGGLPAGEYFVVAVLGELPMDWQDPARLESLSAVATRARVVWGAHLALDVPVVAVR